MFVFPICQLHLCDYVNTLNSVIIRALLDYIRVQLSNVINNFFVFDFESFADYTFGFIKINIRVC